MPNRAYLQDDIIHQIYEGDQDGPVIGDMVAQTEPLVEQLQAAHKPVLILADASKIGATSLHARQAAGRMLTGLPYQKLAVFGAHTRIKYIAQMVILASGKSRKVKLFDTETQAKAWLNS